VVVVGGRVVVGAGGTKGAGGGVDEVTVIVIGVSASPTLFEARSVKVYVPAVVGVPVRTPVTGSNVIPGGSVPA
jgi:hypothetical protein